MCNSCFSQKLCRTIIVLTHLLLFLKIILELDSTQRRNLRVFVSATGSMYHQCMKTNQALIWQQIFSDLLVSPFRVRDPRVFLISLTILILMSLLVETIQIHSSIEIIDSLLVENLNRVVWNNKICSVVTKVLTIHSHIMSK